MSPDYQVVNGLVDFNTLILHYICKKLNLSMIGVLTYPLLNDTCLDFLNLTMNAIPNISPIYLLNIEFELRRKGPSWNECMRVFFIIQFIDVFPFPTV